ncbi:hypothetical protein JCM12298_26070 [Desulfothermus naphthae]
MKKVLLMLVSLMLVAGSAMAMKAISNDEMESITGQAGVSIIIDDAKLYSHIEGLWYADTDGINTDAGANGLWNTVTTNTDGASVGISDLEVMVHVNSITGVNASGDLTSPGTQLKGTYGDLLEVNNKDLNGDGVDDVFLAKPLTIDVTSALPVLSEGAAYDSQAIQAAGGSALPATNFAGVMIGLGTIELVLSNMTLDIALNDLSPLDGSNSMTSINGHDFGTVYVGKTTLTVLDGVIEIAPH